MRRLVQLFDVAYLAFCMIAATSYVGLVLWYWIHG